MRTAAGCWFSSHQTLLQAAEVAAHLPQQQLQLAACHVQLLLGLAAILLWLELRPQSLQGDLLGLPALQLLLQLLQTTVTT